jgi:small conductance mechanosensitive channel
MIVASIHSFITQLDSFIEPIAIIILAYVVSKVLSALIRRYIRRSALIMHFDPTNYSFLQNAVSFFIFIGAALFVFYRIPALHTIGKTLFAGAGVLAAIIGFASQEAFSNIISGIFIVIFKPFSVGDHIKLLSNNQIGVVEDITIRHTILKSIENRRIVIPNGLISREAILNSTIKDPRVMCNIEAIVVYEADIDRTMSLLSEVCMAHPSIIDARTHAEREAGLPIVVVKVVALEDNGIRCRAYVWAPDSDTAFNMKCDLLLAVHKRFDTAGIQLSHAQRVMGLTHVRKA